LVKTAAAMDQQAQWVVWAGRGGFATDTITYHNNRLLEAAELNKLAVQSFILALGEQSLSVWINEPGHELSQFVGLQYSIGDPRYWIGIRPQGGEKTYVPYNAARQSIEIRELQPNSPGARFETTPREAPTAANIIIATVLVPESERFDPSAHANGPFRAPPSSSC
ncbi:MAG: hypothetical protein ABWY71_02235, partial [Candidatus Saccharimonadales bacterium]